MKRYTTYVNILRAPTQGDQHNFQNDIAEETKILNLQSNDLDESNVNYYQSSTERYSSNRTQPRYRSTANDSNKFESDNFWCIKTGLAIPIRQHWIIMSIYPIPNFEINKKKER